jgi:hypothetical protein
LFPALAEKRVTWLAVEARDDEALGLAVALPATKTWMLPRLLPSQSSLIRQTTFFSV